MGISTTEILDWAKANGLEDDGRGSLEREWYNSDCHKTTWLRLMRHDSGYWLIIGSAAGGYGKDDAMNINLGTVQTKRQMTLMLDALNELNPEGSS